MPIALTETDIQAFHRDGYVIRKGFFDKQEIDKLYQLAIGDTVVKENALLMSNNFFCRSMV